MYLFIYKKVINLYIILYISYRFYTWSEDLNTDFTLGNCSFGAVKLTKNADLDKYKCSSYSKGSHSGLHFHTDGSLGKNVIIFGVDNSSSVHSDRRHKNILVLGEEPTQDLDNATIILQSQEKDLC